MPKPVKHIKWRVLSNGSYAAYWQRSVNTPDEQGLFEAKVVTRYVGVVTERDADTKARAFDAEHNARVANFRALSRDRREYVLSIGGIDGLKRRLEALDYLAHVASQVRAIADSIDHRAPLPNTALVVGGGKHLAFTDLGDKPRVVVPSTPSSWAETRADLQDWGDAMGRQASTEHAYAKAVAHKLEPRDRADTLDGLLDVWQKVNPTGNPRKHVASLARLKAHVGGNIPWRSLTREQCSSLRDALVKEYAAGSPTPNKHLNNLKGLFRAARVEGLVKREDSPIRDIGVYGVKNHNGEEEDTGRPFSGKQIKTILARAEETKRFGAHRTEVLWILRLMTWAGLRPNEAAQLRKSDVYVKDGVPIVHVRVTLPPDQQMRLKKGSLRRIPIHPAISDFLAYAQSRDTDAVFDALGFNKDNGRASWLTRRFGAFLRDDCKITTPGGDKRLTLYSLRHSFHDAMRNAEPSIPDDQQRVLGAHGKKDSHERYGKGAELAKLAKAVERINPLALT